MRVRGQGQTMVLGEGETENEQNTHSRHLGAKDSLERQRTSILLVLIVQVSRPIQRWRTNKMVVLLGRRQGLKRERNEHQLVSRSVIVSARWKRRRDGETSRCSFLVVSAR